MPAFSARSKARLATCDDRLQRVMNRVIVDYDCTVLEGHRGQQAQDRAVAEGKSRVRWPNGKHNSYPSRAADVAPYDPRVPGGINWDVSNTPAGRANKARYYDFAGRVKGVASMMGVRIRWGGDWDGDTYFDDQTFNDLVHFEVVDGPPRGDRDDAQEEEPPAPPSRGADGAGHGTDRAPGLRDGVLPVEGRAAGSGVVRGEGGLQRGPDGREGVRPAAVDQPLGSGADRGRGGPGEPYHRDHGRADRERRGDGRRLHDGVGGPAPGGRGTAAEGRVMDSKTLLILKLIDIVAAGLYLTPLLRGRFEATKAKIEAMIAEGRDPTPEEHAELDAERNALVAEIRAAAEAKPEA